MHVLFVHNSFPAQFRFIAPRLAADYGWRCTFATRNGKPPDLPGVARVLYRARPRDGRRRSSRGRPGRAVWRSSTAVHGSVSGGC
jgi:hypothetical protein